MKAHYKIILTLIFLFTVGIFSFLQSTISEEETQLESSHQEINISKEDGLFYAYLTGAVKAPGLYEIKGKTTRAQLLSEAGGALPYANLENENLAEVINPGEHWHIDFNFSGNPEELLRPKLINLNKANKDELTNLPGIGPAMAERIISYRKEKGAFKQIEDIQNVKGIGKKIYEKLKERVSV